jgi:hypothetical protein
VGATSLVDTTQGVEEVEVEETVVTAVTPEVVVEAVEEEAATTTDLLTTLNPRISRAATGHRWIMMTPTRRSAKATTLPYQHLAVPAKAKVKVTLVVEINSRIEAVLPHRGGLWAAKQLTTTQICRITIRDSLHPLSMVGIFLSGR